MNHTYDIRNNEEYDLLVKAMESHNNELNDNNNNNAASTQRLV